MLHLAIQESLNLHDAEAKEELAAYDLNDTCNSHANHAKVEEDGDDSTNDTNSNTHWVAAAWQ